MCHILMQPAIKQINEPGYYRRIPHIYQQGIVQIQIGATLLALTSSKTAHAATAPPEACGISPKAPRLRGCGMRHQSRSLHLCMLADWHPHGHGRLGAQSCRVQLTLNADQAVQDEGHKHREAGCVGRALVFE